MAAATANLPVRLLQLPSLAGHGETQPVEDDVLAVWAYRRPTEEDVRVHAWIDERLALLEWERPGLWPSVRRMLHSSALTRWMVS